MGTDNSTGTENRVKAYIHTFGCKVNSYESAAMAQLLAHSGYEAAPDEKSADIVVVNSCTVTAGGDRKVAQYLRRVRRDNPGAILVLSGCLPQAYPEKAAQLEGVDIVTGTGNRGALPGLIADFLAGRIKTVDILANSQKEFEPLSAESIEGHTRAFLKIEDGCDRFCAYCIVPHARGPVRSMPLQAVADAAARFAAAGYREIVLSGINLSFYGRGQGYDLADAVDAVCAVPDTLRVRLGSLEPDLLTDDMLRRLAGQNKLCPHFHLALQSGCDATLARMNRRYDTALFCDIAVRIRHHFPRPTFTTDVMVGFPGETEADFAQSLAFVRGFDFLKCHIFPYSARPGTAGAALEGQLSKTEKDRRAAAMADAAEETRARVLASFVGQPARVILEQPDGEGFGGYTDRYLPALVTGTCLHTGDVVTGAIRRVENGRCVIEV